MCQINLILIDIKNEILEIYVRNVLWSNDHSGKRIYKVFPKALLISHVFQNEENPSFLFSWVWFGLVLWHINNCRYKNGFVINISKIHFYAYKQFYFKQCSLV